MAVLKQGTSEVPSTAWRYIRHDNPKAHQVLVLNLWCVLLQLNFPNILTVCATIIGWYIFADNSLSILE